MMKKKIAIIGAGLTGLTAGFRLQQSGHEVTIFEKKDRPGGMAGGFKEKAWEWALDEYYHHWFTNDAHVLGLAGEIGQNTIIKRPTTSIYVEEKFYQFDSPQSILLFPKLPLLDKLRMAVAVGLIRYNPFWKPLEGINASRLLPKIMGKNAYRMIWEPQFTNKFGKYAEDVSLAWFWARIRKRTQSLAYPAGGFLTFAQHLADAIKKRGGKIYYNAEIIELISKNNPQLKYKEIENCDHSKKVVPLWEKLKIENYDAVVITTPSASFLKIAPQLPQSYKNAMRKLKSLGATNLVLRLRKKFFPDQTYWLSVCDRSAKIMAIVEHTNFMDKKHYNNEHIVYIGNYLPCDHPDFLASKEELLSLYDPFLRKINPQYKHNLIDYKLFKEPFAQPVIPPHYSKIIPSIITPLRSVYLANIEQVYPWDRGTNYAVELGERVARVVAD